MFNFGLLLAMLVTFNSSLVGTNKLCVFVVIALGINYLYILLSQQLICFNI